MPVAKWLHIHLDEKWFSHLYIKKYTNIHPTYDGFIDFLNKIPIQHHILITTGTIDFELLDELKNKYFEKVNQKIFLRTASNRLIYLIYKPTFDDLESLLRNSEILIWHVGERSLDADDLALLRILAIPPLLSFGLCFFRCFLFAFAALRGHGSNLLPPGASLRQGRQRGTRL